MPLIERKYFQTFFFSTKKQALNEEEVAKTRKYLRALALHKFSSLSASFSSLNELNRNISCLNIQKLKNTEEIKIVATLSAFHIV